jgi:hypothetical protein
VTRDWFRSPDWSPEAQRDFEARLRRARGHSRPQYLRIKGLALGGAGEAEGARQLWLRVLDSTEEFAELEYPGALEHLGDSYAAGNPALAEHYYRRLLAEYPSLGGTTATQHIKLAELLLDRGTAGDVDEAADLLDDWAQSARVPFPNAHFRWQLAAIRVAEAKRDPDASRQAARTALSLAGLGPVFPRHKTVGVVHADKATLKRLRKLAR